ncbi:hypothetical protein BJX76DRAFT_352338 [Aspergillus varians]
MSDSWKVPVTFEPRNVHILSGCGDYLEVHLKSPIKTFHNMYQHFIHFPTTTHCWKLHRLGQQDQIQELVPRDPADIQQGRYVAIHQIPTNQHSTHKLRSNKRHFRDTLFQRDHERCFIAGRQGPGNHPRFTLIADHIFPIAKRNIWVNNSFEDRITDRTNTQTIGPNKILSAQNGAILPGHLFGEDLPGISGRVLDRSIQTGDPNHRVSDDCLRWHYYQAILTHMRGAGEVWEIEFGNRLGPYSEDT